MDSAYLVSVYGKVGLIKGGTRLLSPPTSSHSIDALSQTLGRFRLCLSACNMCQTPSSTPLGLYGPAMITVDPPILTFHKQLKSQPRYLFDSK